MISEVLQLSAIIELHMKSDQQKLRKFVWTYAVFSRLLILIFSAASNALIPDHVSADAFQAPELECHSNWKLDNIIECTLGGLLRWDAEHFAHIAESGYTYENNLAFFPLYPYCIQMITRTLNFVLGDFLCTRTIFLLAAVSFNISLFIVASYSLFDLTMKLFDDPLISFKTTVFFCFSPATIFFVAPYSESLFVACVFQGMLACINQNIVYSCIWFALGSSVRSNGILNAGFIVHLLFHYLLMQCKSRKFTFISSAIRNLKLCFYMILSTVVVCLPYFAFQIFCYYSFCIDDYKPNLAPRVLNYGIQHNLTMPINVTEWCNFKIPFSYFFIQNKYWGVGFLQYYSFKQIPNFLLASPMVLLVLIPGIKYLHFHRYLLFNPRLIYKYNSKKFGSVATMLPRCAFVHVTHVVFLTIYCVLFINVQVITRMIASSSPFIYWLVAFYFNNIPKHYDKPKKRNAYKFWQVFPILERPLEREGNLIKWYFFSYIFLGVILFSNNLPWT